MGDTIRSQTLVVRLLIEPYAPTTDASMLLVLERLSNGSYRQHPCTMQLRPIGVVAGNFVGDARTDAIIVTGPYFATNIVKPTIMVVQQSP